MSECINRFSLLKNLKTLKLYKFNHSNLYKFNHFSPTKFLTKSNEKNLQKTKKDRTLRLDLKLLLLRMCDSDSSPEMELNEGQNL
jgi:hypothetical protein